MSAFDADVRDLLDQGRSIDEIAGALCSTRACVLAALARRVGVPAPSEIGGPETMLPFVRRRRR